jgi:hypothetical protein
VQPLRQGPASRPIGRGCSLLAARKVSSAARRSSLPRPRSAAWSPCRSYSIPGTLIAGMALNGCPSVLLLEGDHRTPSNHREEQRRRAACPTGELARFGRTTRLNMLAHALRGPPSTPPAPSHHRLSGPAELAAENGYSKPAQFSAVGFSRHARLVVCHWPFWLAQSAAIRALRCSRRSRPIWCGSACKFDPLSGGIGVQF